MPLYEYACRACATAFERRRKFEERQAEAACPRCGGEAALVLSVPARVGATRSSAAAPCDTGPSCCGGGMCGIN